MIRPKTARHVRAKTNLFHLFLLTIGVVLGVLIILAKRNPYFPFDLQITLFIQQQQTPVFSQFLAYLTELGNFPEEIILPAVTAAILFIIGDRKAGIVAFISAYGIIGISETLKRIVARPRPDGHLIVQIGQYARPDSFPSGHVLFYIGFFGFISYLIFVHKEPSWLKKTLLFIAGFLILSVGISRIYFGAHWFSDTLGSYLLGILWLSFIVHFYRRLYIK